MRKGKLLFAAPLLILWCVVGQAVAYFEDDHLIQVVYQKGGQYEVATDLGSFAPTAPYSGAVMSFTANPFPAAGSAGLFSSAAWSDLQVAYYVKDTTSDHVWISGPQAGQVSGNRQYSGFSTGTTSVNNKYAQLGTAQGQLLQTDIDSYYQRMDQGDYTIDAGRFGGFLQQPRYYGEQNLAALSSGGGHVDSYLYYYATPKANGAQTGLQAAVVRTFADGHAEVMPASANNNCAAVLNADLSLHIPVLTFNNQAYSLDLSYIPNTLDFTVAGVGVVADTTPYSGCAPATLTNDLKIHIPALMFQNVSFWLDLAYKQGMTFTVTGAGAN